MKQLLDRFARSITSHPLRYLTGLVLVAGLAATIASGLGFQSSYLALLPENAPEVHAIKTVNKYTGGTNELVIAVGGPKSNRLPFARRAVDRLNRSPGVQWAQVEYPVKFFQDRALLMLPESDLKQVRAAMKTVIDRAKVKANPMYVDLEDEEDEEDQLAALRRLEQKQKKLGAELKRTRTTSDGKYLLIMVKPRASMSQLDESRPVLAQIKQEVEAAQRPGDRVPVRFAGGLVSAQKENQIMGQDLSRASAIALILAIILITIVTRKLGATLIIGVPLVLGVMVTLAVATLTIGHLNLVSGFLVAALVGLGIDFGIHLYLRFLDEMARIYDHREAMRRAIMATFGPSLTAAATTSAAFLALLLADFRGFSEYGAIAAMGVLLTLVVTFLALPPLALVFARFRRPRGPAALDRQGQRRLKNTRQLAKPLAWAMMACGLGFLALSAGNMSQVGFKNNFKALGATSDAQVFEDYIIREMGGSLAPALIMVDGYDQVRRAEALIKNRRDRQVARDGSSPIGRVVSVATLVPRRQEAKLAIMADIRRHADVLLQGEFAKRDADKIRDLKRLAAARAWTEREVPGAFRRRLVSDEGHKYFLLAWSSSRLVDDRKIQAWAGVLDQVKRDMSRDAITALVLDENLVAARVLTLIRSDGPRVMVLSVLAVFLILALDFRRLDRVLLVGGSVVTGVVAMLGVMSLFDLHINLFNAVVLPTVLGIGIDNAVHLQHAYAARGKRSIPLVMATCGRAALLSTATTAIGFGSAIVAHHGGIQQMGILALVGIGCTFVFATILFPAALRLLEREGPDTPTPAAAPAEPLVGRHSSRLVKLANSASR